MNKARILQAAQEEIVRHGWDSFMQNPPSIANIHTTLKDLLCRGPFVAVVALLIANYAFAQTTIVAIRARDALYLGADSMVGRWDGSEKWFACKIHHTGGIFTAYARNIVVDGSDLDIPNIADKALHGTGTLKKRISRFDVEISDKLRVWLQKVKNKEPVFFEQHADGQSVSDVVFMGFENGQPKMFVRRFLVGVTNNRVVVEPKTRDCPGECSKGRSTVYLGHHEIIDREVASNPRIWDRGVSNAIEFLIQKESTGEPSEVGGPIALLQIDKSGPHWLQYGSCEPQAR